MPASRKQLEASEPRQSNESAVPSQEGRRCVHCGGSWLAIGFQTILSKTCPFCGARPHDSKEGAR